LVWLPRSGPLGAVAQTCWFGGTPRAPPTASRGNLRRMQNRSKGGRGILQDTKTPHERQEISYGRWRPPGRCRRRRSPWIPRWLAAAASTGFKVPSGLRETKGLGQCVDRSEHLNRPISNGWSAVEKIRESFAGGTERAQPKYPSTRGAGSALSTRPTRPLARRRRLAAGARRRAEPEIAGALFAKPRGAQHEGGGERTTSALLLEPPRHAA